MSYFFEILSNEKFTKDLLSRNKLERTDSVDLLDKPGWFALKPIDSYEIWRYVDEPLGNFRVLIDRETGNYFYVTT